MAASHTATAPAPHRPWWPWAKRVLSVAFFALVAWLLVKHARAIEWGSVLDAVRALPAWWLALAAVLAVASHALYSTFDLLGRAATGHHLPVVRVMKVNFISYAFNLNFGSLVGGVAFRYRLYSRLGLDNARITKVLAISMFTNWLGYVFLAGLVLLVQPPALPEGWRLDSEWMRPIGAVLLALPLVYLLACRFSTRREWSLRGRSLQLPTLGFGLAQLAMSALNWALIGGIVYALLPERVGYLTTLGVLLLAAVAGVIAHVPAGLGVLEAVFVTLLAGLMPQDELIASLLAYRALYYLLPLLAAAGLYLFVELRVARRERK